MKHLTILLFTCKTIEASAENFEITQGEKYISITYSTKEVYKTTILIEKKNIISLKIEKGIL